MGKPRLELVEVIPFPLMWAVNPTALLLLLRCDKADPYVQQKAPGALSRLGLSMSVGIRFGRASQT